MANEMLKFKKGLYANLPTAKAPGTIYVTTDEKAMYVDISASDRIRIGDIIRVATFDQLQPPFSDEAFYYVESENALLKRVPNYDESGNVIAGTYKWKQINSTAEIASAVNTLTDKVSTLESVVGTAASGLVKDMADAKQAITNNANAIGHASDEANNVEATGVYEHIEDHAADIEALKKAVGMGEDGNVEGLGGRVADLEAADIVINNTLSDHAATLEQHTTAINARVTTEYAESTYAKTAVIQPTLNKVDTEGTVSAAIAKETQRAEEKELELTNSISATNAEVANVKAKAEEGVTKAEAAQDAADDAMEAAKARVLTETYEKFVEDNTLVIEGINQDIKDIEDSISDLQEEATKHVTNDAFNTFKEANTAAIAKAEQAGTDAQTAIDNYSKAHESDYTNEQIDAKFKTVNDASSDLSQDIQDVAKDLSDYQKDVAKTYTTKEDFQDVVDQLAGIDGTVKSYVDDEIGKVEQAIEDLETEQGGAISDLQDAVDKLNGGATEDGSVAKAVADAKAELEKQITDDIAAANAMEYREGIGSYADLLKIDTEEKGATYVATGAFTITGKGDVLPGDLLIATGEEDATGFIPEGNLTWTIVHTGYDATLEQRLTTVANNEGKNVIQLTSAVGAVNNGQIAFVADADSAAVVSVENNTVTFGIVWEDFPVSNN